MASIHSIRVAAVGNEADMIRLNRVLLSNGGWLNDPDDRPPYSLQELYEQVHEHALWESGNTGTFLYDMLTELPYGQAEGGARYEINRVDADLYVALFIYRSADHFQAEDWLRLHERCDRLPMFVLQAEQNFGGDKGGLVITNGQEQEDWSRMAESWLWLTDGYEAGLSPEEAVQRLREVAASMAREEWEQTIPELLQNCMDNLHAVEEHSHVTGEQLAQCLEVRDFNGLFALQSALADAYLWDVDRSVKYQAILQGCLEAWNKAETED